MIDDWSRLHDVHPPIFAAHLGSYMNIDVASGVVASISGPLGLKYRNSALGRVV